MTGFIGERTNRAAALMTDDFRIYHALAPWFERHGVQLLGLRPGDEVPPAVHVLLGGPDDDPRSVPLTEDPEAAWLLVASALDPRRDGAYDRVVIGIDPGETIGLAVLADGAVLWVAEAHDAEQVPARLDAWRGALHARHWEVHVGDGAPEVGRSLVRALRGRWPGTAVAVVPEKASSPAAPVTQSRHTDAAIHIAMRSEP